jgi:hypothetical protein
VKRAISSCAVWFAAVCLGLAGCGGEPPPAMAPWPRLLTETEIDAYRKAEEALKVEGRSLAEIRALCLIQRDDSARELARFGFTPESFVEVAELIFFARNGHENFAELPRKKQAFLKQLIAQCRSTGETGLAERFEQELAQGSKEIQDSEFVMTVLANAQLLAEYERKHPPPAATTGAR